VREERANELGDQDKMTSGVMFWNNELEHWHTTSQNHRKTQLLDEENFSTETLGFSIEEESIN